MRTCGECKACCTVMAVVEIDKAADTTCKHVCNEPNAAGGCGIYETRPEPCKDFVCMWLHDDGKIFRHMERPDKVGIMFDVTHTNGEGQCLVARATRPGAFNEVAGKKLIERLSKHVAVILMENATAMRQLIGPEAIVKKVKQLADYNRRNAKP